MIKLEEVYGLNSPQISAASGLLLHEENFYCVSDDEMNLVWFPSHLSSPTQSLPLFQGQLPVEHKERKKLKPDLESLVYVPHLRSILCLPSGSTQNRDRGALVNPANKVQVLSFSHTYASLKDYFPELNIEGSVIVGETIRLFQRGNGRLNQNAIIDLDLKAFLNDEIKNLSLSPIHLGALHECQLSFTDACYDLGSYWFLAVAEKTDSTYEDGEFAGAILGKMNPHGAILERYELEIPYKPEGLVVNNQEIFLVTDADNRSIPSKLFKGKIPHISAS